MSAKLKRVLIFLGILILLSSANMGFETHWKNPVGWILFGLGVLGTAAGAIYLGVTVHRQAIRLDQRDISLWLLLPGVLLVGVGAPLEFILLPACMPRSEIIEILGMVISVAGILVSVIGGRVQLPQYQRETPVEIPTQIPTRKQTNLFAAGLWLAMFGIALGYSSLIGLAASLILLLPGAILRQKLAKG